MRDWWTGPRGPTGRALHAAALPVELAFQSAVALRTRAYDAGWLAVHRATVPVLCVGNLTVGGTGKTPLAAWIVGTLLEGGLRPAVVARGYDDEVRLHRRWHPETRVHGDPDRVAAARAAAAAGADVIVADDGFQHRRLARDLDVVLVSAEQPLPGSLLPRGPFREPADALRRADWVVVTRRTADAASADRTARAVRRIAPHMALVQARLVPAAWTMLDGAPAAAPVGDLLAVAAIADPGSFARLLRGVTGARVELLAWEDHHPFDAVDMGRIDRAAHGRPVVVTEKDAVKLAALAPALPDVRVLTLRLELEAGAEPLRAAVLKAARAGREAPPRTNVARR